MPDLVLTLNQNHPQLLALTATQRRAAQIVIGSEWEKVNFVRSGAGLPGSQEIVVPYLNGTVIPEYSWDALSGYYKTRLADMVAKGWLNILTGGLSVPAYLVSTGVFDADWVLQETFTLGGAGNNGVPVNVDEGLYIADRESADVNYRITFTPGTTYDYQLYEWNGAAWAVVVGHAGLGVTGDVMGTYTVPAGIERLYMYIAFPAAGGTTALEIGKVTAGSISTYDRGIVLATPDPVPTGDDGIDVSGRDRLFVAIEFTTLGGAPSCDVDIWGRIGGVWGAVRAGTFPGITANWEDWFGVDRGYERMYVQVTAIAAGAVVAKTLKAVTLP